MSFFPSTPATTKGKVISAASTNATLITGAACVLTNLNFTNTSTSVRWVKLYDKASAPTVGTDVPVHVYGVPPSTSGLSGSNPSLGAGLQFTLGLAIAITGGQADTDTTAVVAGDIVVNYGYHT